MASGDAARISGYYSLLGAILAPVGQLKALLNAERTVDPVARQLTQTFGKCAVRTTFHGQTSKYGTVKQRGNCAISSFCAVGPTLLTQRGAAVSAP